MYNTKLHSGLTLKTQKKAQAVPGREINNGSTIDPTLLYIRAFGFEHKRINPHPQQRENGSQEDGPDNDNCRGPVLPAHETFEEWIEMDDHPEGEEQLPKQRSP